MSDATKLTPFVCRVAVLREGAGYVLAVIDNCSVRPLTREELEQLVARLAEAEKQIAALTRERDLWRAEADNRRKVGDEPVCCCPSCVEKRMERMKEGLT